MWGIDFLITCIFEYFNFSILKPFQIVIARVLHGVFSPKTSRTSTTTTKGKKRTSDWSPFQTERQSPKRKRLNWSNSSSFTSIPKIMHAVRSHFAPGWECLRSGRGSARDARSNVGMVWCYRIVESTHSIYHNWLFSDIENTPLENHSLAASDSKLIFSMKCDITDTEAVKNTN